jgi:hypothetical protein
MATVYGYVSGFLSMAKLQIIIWCWDLMVRLHVTL